MRSSRRNLWRNLQRTPDRAMSPATVPHNPDTVALMGDGRATLADFARKFAEIRSESERTIAQLDATAIRRSLDGDVNSVAIIMKHVGGNLRSRFTDFLASDGEKPWRDREQEFVDDFPPGEQGRVAAFDAWCTGWQSLERTLAALTDADLRRTVLIRGQPHSVALALARAVAHLGYHQGQITLIARMLVGPSSWKTISIPRGGTAAHHAEMGFDAGSGTAPHSRA